MRKANLWQTSLSEKKKKKKRQGKCKEKEEQSETDGVRALLRMSIPITHQ